MDIVINSNTRETEIVIGHYFKYGAEGFSYLRFITYSGYGYSAETTVIIFPEGQPIIIDLLGRETNQYEWIKVIDKLYCLVAMRGKKDLIALEDFKNFYKLKE